MLEIWQSEKNVPWIPHIFLLRAPKSALWTRGLAKEMYLVPVSWVSEVMDPSPSPWVSTLKESHDLDDLGTRTIFGNLQMGDVLPHFMDILMGTMIVSYWNLRGSWCSRGPFPSIYISNGCFVLSHCSTGWILAISLAGQAESMIVCSSL